MLASLASGERRLQASRGGRVLSQPMGRPFHGGWVHRTTTLRPWAFFADRGVRNSYLDSARKLGSAEVSTAIFRSVCQTLPS